MPSFSHETWREIQGEYVGTSRKTDIAGTRCCSLNDQVTVLAVYKVVEDLRHRGQTLIRVLRDQTTDQGHVRSGLRVQGDRLVRADRRNNDRVAAGGVGVERQRAKLYTDLGRLRKHSALDTNERRVRVRSSQ